MHYVYTDVHKCSTIGGVFTVGVDRVIILHYYPPASVFFYFFFEIGIAFNKYKFYTVRNNLRFQLFHF